MSQVRRPRRHSWLYNVYVGSWLWRVRRRLWFRASDGRCEACGSRLFWSRRDALLAGASGAQVLNVHHRTYARLGRERRGDVELICGGCHYRRHAGSIR